MNLRVAGANDSDREGVASRRAVMFEALIYPATTGDFLGSYWRRRPMHARAANRLTSARDILRPEDIDAILNAAAANANDFDFFMSGNSADRRKFTGPGDYVMMNSLLGMYAGGGTIHVTNIQKYHQAMDSLCKTLQQELQCDVEGDLWLTRMNSFDPYLHFDSHDIFVLQTQGRKRWRLFEQIEVHENRATAAVDWNVVGDPVLDILLEPGDLLYLPPYTPHAVTTVDEHSVQVGLGVHPTTWRQVLEQALAITKDAPGPLQDVLPLAIATDAIPPGALLEALSKIVGRALAAVDPVSLDAANRRRFLEDMTHARDAHFTSRVLGAASLDEGSAFERRPDTSSDVYLAADGRAVLRFSGGGFFSGPSDLLEDLTFIAQAEGSMFAHDLPGRLDGKSRVLLVRKLVEAGFLRRRTT